VSLGEVKSRPLMANFCLWVKYFMSLRVYFCLGISDLGFREFTLGSCKFLAIEGK